MKDKLSFAPIPDRRLNDQDQNRVRTLWYADGRSLSALVTKVDRDGIHFSTAASSGFIPAVDLCTADRVRYGFGSRSETKWVERVTATLDKQKTALITPKIAK